MLDLAKVSRQIYEYLALILASDSQSARSNLLMVYLVTTFGWVLASGYLPTPGAVTALAHG